MSERATALVLHGEDATAREFNLQWDRQHPQIVDEREALRLAGAYGDGANAVASRIASGLFPEKYAGAWLSFVRQYQPTYAQLRNFLEGDCNVAPILAARVALRHTRSPV